MRCGGEAGLQGESYSGWGWGRGCATVANVLPPTAAEYLRYSMYIYTHTGRVRRYLEDVRGLAMPTSKACKQQRVETLHTNESQDRLRVQAE